MNLLRSKSKAADAADAGAAVAAGAVEVTSNVLGAAPGVAAQAQQASASAQQIAGQAMALAADGQVQYQQLRNETEAKVSEGIELKAILEDKDVPLQVKLVKTLSFLKGPIGGLLALLWKALCCLLPLYQALFAFLYKAYTWAPKKLVTMVFGAVLAFFGGTYVTSLAAIEAFRTMGGERLWGDVVYVYEQVLKVQEASDKDDAETGTSAMELLDAGKHAELAQRKVHVVMTTIKEPGRLENAVGSLWSAYVAVLATLSLQFAQVAALALGMASTVKPLVARFVVPILEYALDPNLHHWIASIVSVSLNLAAMFIAWTLVAVIASVYAGLRGGRMFADALFGMIDDWKLVERLPEWDVCGKTLRERCRPWLTPETSLLDEVVMYTLAGVGIYSQVFSGFAIIFPLNLVLFPLTVVEWWLRYQVTFGGAGASGA